MSDNFDIIVVGSANTDYVVRTARLPQPGETVKGDEFISGQGGKGANQAVAAARLGARVAFVARVGTDSQGDAVIANLQREGVDTRYVIRDRDYGTGAAVVIVDGSGQKYIISVSNANRQLSAMDVQAASSVISKCRVLLSQLESPLDTVLAAAQLAHAGGAKVLLDPAPAQTLPPTLLPLIDVMKPNPTEAAILSGINPTDERAARAAAQQILALGVGAVSLHFGDSGSLLAWPGGEILVPRFTVKTVDATGAGDAFIAALGVQIAEGATLPQAARFASAAAALSTTVVGAQAGLPSRRAVQELLSKE